MYRNDTIIPFFALLFSAALFLMSYLNGQRIAVLTGHKPEELSVGQIGLMAFAAVLFIYGAIGYISAWLEGQELRPGRHFPEPSTSPLVAGIVLVLLLTAMGGFFVQLLVYSAQSGQNPTWLQGGFFAAMALIIAALLAIYKKFYQREEVVTEDEHSEVPW
ncbi:hypothetical protein [Meiothermus rufus]|uniref:hypothetical protein n=1 Tax=Meiothermus rufus TaxID=604332 RepID=UPI000410597B|nr:hypothetical protein [Meiothermus rufus]